MAFKTEGIVLHQRELKGADRVYELLTPDHGKLSVIARGAARSSSKMAGHLSPFSHVKIMVGRGRQDHLAGARTIAQYRKLREDWFDFILASSLVELLVTMNVPGEAARAEFELLKRTFHMLSEERERQDKVFIARIFLWKMLALSGWRPNITHCAISRDVLDRTAVYYRSPKGFVSEANRGNGTHIPIELVQFLEHVIDNDDIDALLREAGSNGMRTQWLHLSKEYYQDIISKPLHSLKLFSYV